ncbi:MAG: AAA family ATPase [Polyangiaceae bacterium]
MPPRIPIGIDDFRALREAKLEYVDKTGMIRELIDRAGVQVALFPRPRRFGKTLNLSMLRCWFEKTPDDLSPLFQDLSIWRACPDYRSHFQRYPVIHFSFKETRHDSFERCLAAIHRKVQVLFGEHAYLLRSPHLAEHQRRDFQAILDGAAPPVLLDRALLDLSSYLHAHHREKVLILIDEYDEPVHAGHVHGYSPRILDFMRAFLGAGLKSNAHLFKAVVTGILRVAKEDLFSGLNNLDVYTLLARPFGTAFGFTEPEVTDLLERCARTGALGEVRRWYNGYVFGGEVVYNPWSVCNFLQREDEVPKAYWLSTSSNDLVRELLERHALELWPTFETLLAGGAIEHRLDENVVFREVHERKDALWSLLCFSGYLRAEESRRDELGRPIHRLSIPNLEVREVYSSTFARWMERRIEAQGGSIDRLTRALLGGDAAALEEQLQSFVTDLISYHDPGKLHPERVYQAFIVGLLAVLEPSHQVRSNRESGQGRPDVLVRPARPGNPGVVLELKVARPGKRTLEEALTEGLTQLSAMDYAAELRAAGASPIQAFAVAFDGKLVRVRAA